MKTLLIGINPAKFKDVDDEVFQAVIKVADNDGDGNITFEEFVAKMEGVTVTDKNNWYRFA